jgi:hypothetical protein
MQLNQDVVLASDRKFTFSILQVYCQMKVARYMSSPIFSNGKIPYKYSHLASLQFCVKLLWLHGHE